MKRVLITGANSGLGLALARALVMKGEINTLFLGCRDPGRGKAAQQEVQSLSQSTEVKVLSLDLADFTEINAALESIYTLLDAPLDALVMNAGGMGKGDFAQKTPAGVTRIFANNVLGHLYLLEALAQKSRLTQVAIFAGSEAARGLPRFGLPCPQVASGSMAEFITIANGQLFGAIPNQGQVYAYIKLMGILAMSALARGYPQLRLVSVSPGATANTGMMANIPPAMKQLFELYGNQVLSNMGLLHSLDEGVARYLKVLSKSVYKSGNFYGSKGDRLTGPLVEQSRYCPIFRNLSYQDQALAAIRSFYPGSASSSGDLN